jgi:hypothetical protein
LAILDRIERDQLPIMEGDMPQTLLPSNEKILMTARFHWINYLRPFAIPGVLMIASYPYFTGKALLVVDASLLGIALIAFRTVWSARSTGKLSITNMHVTYTEGAQQPVVFRTEEIDSLHVEGSIIAQMCGFATLQVRAAGQNVKVPTAVITIGR